MWATSTQLEAALHGRVTDHDRFMLKLHLDQIDAQDAAIARIDKEVDGNVEPFRVALEMLNGIPGVSSLSAEVIIAEIGVDMSRFETAGRGGFTGGWRHRLRSTKLQTIDREAVSPTRSGRPG